MCHCKLEICSQQARDVGKGSAFEREWYVTTVHEMEETYTPRYCRNVRVDSSHSCARRSGKQSTRARSCTYLQADHLANHHHDCLHGIALRLLCPANSF